MLVPPGTVTWFDRPVTWFDRPVGDADVEGEHVRQLLPAAVAALSVVLAVTPAYAGSQRLASPAADTPARALARTENGLIEGASGAGYRVFNGVPYAAPPTGPNRWRVPQPATDWHGVRDATTLPAECAQNPIGGGGPITGAEDCLHVNVTTPPNRTGRHPVLVFLHGGSFTAGSANQYDPRRLAADGNLVVVTVNYRLGVFGYFGLPGLPGSGTFGLQDQQAALRWVQRNIAAFGGDPRHVTLAGESSGGMSVCAQLTAPSAVGLFDKAIIQSGSCLTDWPDGLFLPGIKAGSQFSSLAAVQNQGAQLRDRFGCATVACLRAASYTDLLHQTQGAGLAAFATPAYGTPLLPARPADALRSGRYQHMPVLEGGNLDEHRAFLGFTELYPVPKPYTPGDYRAALRTAFGDRAGQVEARYPVAAWGTPGLAWAAVATDRIWACPTLEQTRLLAERNRVYGYEFAERDGPVLDPRYPWGAAHGLELAYLFDMDFLTDQTQPELRSRFVTAWSRFASTGTPGWPRMPYVQTFADDRSGNVDLAAEHQCGFWSSVPR
ncbi:carboxylesterase family protein [Micromonospora sp. NPDC049230]|uniref:carboxylesterase/lipase family protein n=1 Tax=Micromonospora sp. NPDC049230 TaxID=3155502 RepID=UPI0033DC0936